MLQLYSRGSTEAIAPDMGSVSELAPLRPAHALRSSSPSLPVATTEPSSDGPVPMMRSSGLGSTTSIAANASGDHPDHRRSASAKLGGLQSIAMSLRKRAGCRNRVPSLRRRPCWLEIELMANAEPSGSSTFTNLRSELVLRLDARIGVGLSGRRSRECASGRWETHSDTGAAQDRARRSN